MDQLKVYCESSSIKEYDIIIRNKFEDEIFTLNPYNNEENRRELLQMKKDDPSPYHSEAYDYSFSDEYYDDEDDI